jgi:hypothetical protein
MLLIQFENFENTPSTLDNLNSACTKPFLRIHLTPVTAKDIKNIIKSLKMKNSYGYDEIPPRILKISLPYITSPLIHKRINKDNNQQDWIPHHQFGFRQAHSTVQQCHRITDIINKALEDHQYCTAAFLDVSQAFDKAWHPGLLLKIKKTLPPGYFYLLKSYLQDRYFITKFNNKTSSRYPIHSGVPQGSIFSPLLYTLYTSDLPTSRKTTLSTFADDTTVVATHSDPTTASLNLQDHLNSIEKWLQKGRMKVNETKSTHITFTLRKEQCPPVSINQTVIP